ncbi:aspartate aminotransferase family protein [Myxococcus sp. RHSTA-1-4]|uniref:aspartate aminotransferase family protein n=1 Tax=Myxococcus sp. RHSTA-1-4 TaxID=2874601 RepID=UPI001CBD5921|nr:aminotransferase class III-fold pyridoxal phosphate-dependent enzyme [Myxococcus sp. RHSTA-1-4]MBZ4421277.1 aminotransferase class III-fold pyridoxal phosphate-dependent enzyme [Myxococcus sp. RHSTA-1-4]
MSIQPGLPALLPTYAPYPFPIVRGEGDRLHDDQGRVFLDWYGGHCVCATGHSHPRVAEAVAAQARSLLFYSMAASLPVRDAAAAKLVEFAPEAMASVFFCNSGAEANESALKIALVRTGRKRLVSFQGGWHGRTLLTLSVTDDPPLTKPLADLLVPAHLLPFNDVAALEATDLSDVAAVIVEPIQSIAGARVADAAWLEALRRACDASGALLIFDEIQTGMGRTGAPFAAQRFGVTPDLITCAKAMASGVPMGAVLMSAPVARGLKPGDLGSTFGGGPLACAALSVTLDIIRDERLMERALHVEAVLRRELEGSVVRQIHGAGLLLGLRVGPRASALRQHLLASGILVGGSHDPDVLRLMPPLAVREASVTALIEAIRAFS